MANVLKTYKKRERTPLEEDAFRAKESGMSYGVYKSKQPGNMGMIAQCRGPARTENGRIITSSEDGVVLQRTTTTQIIANDKIVVSGGRRL